MEPIIKKTTDGNQYYLTPQNLWVRNFCLEQVPFVDINKTIKSEDHFVFLENEVRNSQNKYVWIDTEDFNMTNVVIVSDGYGYEKKQQLLAKLPKDVTIMAVNGALAKWNIPTRIPSWYIVNNPYEECMRFFPRRLRILPKVVASVRTNHNFMTLYRGQKYRYYPVNEKQYASLGQKDVSWQVDDYRNPICAAIHIAVKYGALKILLFCCDNSFELERPGAEKLNNGLYQYPQQNIVNGLIDGQFFWLKSHPYFDYELGNCSSGKDYEFAEYISEEKIFSFFQQGGEK